MGKRERLDVLLVERQLVTSREDARRRILAAEVLVNEQPITKAGTFVEITAEIRVKAASPFVSRGGVKLAKGLGEFSVDVTDKIALDVGASTGGFTDCLLAHGARHVYAVDVGYGQLAWKLRNDSRVTVFEKTNIRYLQRDQLLSCADVCTIDVSFISLRLVLPQVKTLTCPGADVVALIKPQFEVGKGRVGKGGVVTSDDEHMRVIDEVQSAAIGVGFTICGVIESPLRGPKGNKEFLLHLKSPDLPQ
jgi:23S rRNA (cytidine1920-2'-O)/16S rRNA (cytidine1409-2'-O)-methyltransferase